MMVTYDGKVGMCCNDWGAQYNLGYLNELGFDSKKEEENFEKCKRKQKRFFTFKDKNAN